MIEWWTAERAVALATAVQALVVLGALWYGKHQVDVAKALRSDQAEQAAAALHATTRPYMTLHLDGEQLQGFAFLVIENLGQTPAFDLEFDVDPPLPGSVSHPTEVTPLNRGVHSIAPRQRISCLFEATKGRDPALARRWTVQLTYRDAGGRQYVEVQTLSFDHYWDTTTVKRNGLHELHGVLEHLVRVLERDTRRTREPTDDERARHATLTSRLLGDRNAAAEKGGGDVPPQAQAKQPGGMATGP